MEKINPYDKIPYSFEVIVKSFSGVVLLSQILEANPANGIRRRFFAMFTMFTSDALARNVLTKSEPENLTIAIVTEHRIYRQLNFRELLNFHALFLAIKISDKECVYIHREKKSH